MRGARWLAAVVVAFIVGACGVSAPVPDAGEVTDELIATGDRLYQASCAICHGADLRGTDRGPSHLSIVYEPNHHSDAAFLLAVRNGSRAHHWTFGDMPPIPGLSDADVAAITAFVRDTQTREGFEE